VTLEIVPAPDGLITLEQAAALTGRSRKTVWAWTSAGYRAPDGTRVKVKVKRRDGWLIMVDPVEIAKAAHATDPKGLYRRFPSLAAA
jgi:predicted DNA-binding transcriptional regulator AlpA